MKRRTFAKLGAAALLSYPVGLRAQTPRRLIIIGAGSAGLTAAYHARRAGFDVRVLEASGRWGGRIKRLTGLSDMPYDLGAEWIHDEPMILGEIIGAGPTDLGVETLTYRPQTYEFFNNDRLRSFDAARHFYAEVKFLNTTWYGFFERFVVPEIADRISLNTPVTQVSRNGAEISVRTSNGQTYAADQVLITVPISVLQQGQISIASDLAPPDLGALSQVSFGAGLKVFMKFTDRFYADMMWEGPRGSVLSDSWDAELFYDANFGKPTAQNVLALFNVAENGIARAGLSDEALLADVLAQLTRIYGGVVEQSFVSGTVQNWSQEPYIGGSYSMTNYSDTDISDILSPQSGQLFFAGEALGDNAQSTVHGAAFSAIEAVEAMAGA